MRGWLVVAVVVCTSSRATAKPGAIIIPPAEVDIGAGTALGNVAVGTAVEIRAGVHWASLAWEPTSLDLGVGYIGSFCDVASGYAPRMAELDDNKLSLHGLYLSAAYAIEMHTHWRTWLGARIEGMSGNVAGESTSVIGGALRLAVEWYSTGVGAGGSSRTIGFFAGSFALGVYVEGTRRTLPAELGPLGAGAGLTLRIPFIAALGD